MKASHAQKQIAHGLSDVVLLLEHIIRKSKMGFPEGYEPTPTPEELEEQAEAEAKAQEEAAANALDPAVVPPGPDALTGKENEDADETKAKVKAKAAKTAAAATKKEKGKVG